MKVLVNSHSGKGKYIYLLENRSATDPNLRLLKVGKTAGGYSTVYARGAAYRTVALHRKPLTLHVFEVSEKLAEAEILEAFEMAVRKTLYRTPTLGVGSPWLPDDHEQPESGWRPDGSLYHFQK